MIVQLGATIRKIRDTLTLSQSEMAKIIGIHVQTLSKWERGEQVPSLETLADIIKKLNIPPLWLFLGITDESQKRAAPIFERIKKVLNITTDEELKEQMGIGLYVAVHEAATPPRIMEFCDEHGLNLEWLLTGEGEMLRSQRPRPMPVDTEILAEVGKTVEAALDKENVHLTPKKKAAIVAYLYDEIIEDPEKRSHLKEKVIKFLKLQK